MSDNGNKNVPLLARGAEGLEVGVFANVGVGHGREIGCEFPDASLLLLV